MRSLMLILALLGDPFDFVKKPEVKPTPIEVKAEEPAKVEEQLVGARIDERDEQIKRLEKENAELRSGMDALRKQNAEMEKTVASVPQFEITDFSKLQQAPSAPPVQMVITSAPGCAFCKPLCDNVIAKLRPLGFTVSEDLTAQIRINHITDAEWNRLGITLPRVVIVTRGVEQVIAERDPYKLGHLWNSAVLLEREMPPLPSMETEKLAGMAVATVPGKQAVMQLLAMLEPFLDGGTLQVIYTAKPGVVKKFLTIKQGPLGIKIPPKTTFELSMKSGDLTVRLLDPKPELLMGPLDRGIQEIDITPNKISLRLPWMIDPELKLK